MPDARELTPEEVSASVAKMLAEAEKAKAETEAARAEARKTDIQAQQVAAEAEIAVLDLAKRRRAEVAELAADKHHRRYLFNGEVSAASVASCMSAVNEWVRADDGRAPSPIEIVFNSPGGSVIAGMALWDYLQSVKAMGHHLTTSTIGYAASMGGILLQAGHERVMGRESWLMIHEASFGASGKTGEVEDTVEWIKKVQERILAIFAARSNLTVRQLKNKWHRKDWWLSSDEALKLGLVDSIR